MVGRCRRDTERCLGKLEDLEMAVHIGFAADRLQKLPSKQTSESRASLLGPKRGWHQQGLAALIASGWSSVIPGGELPAMVS